MTGSWVGKMLGASRRPNCCPHNDKGTKSKESVRRGRKRRKIMIASGSQAEFHVEDREK
jgi:hypothetical protein